MFHLQANKIYLEVCAKEGVTSGSVNVYTVRFSFNSDWDGLDRTAVFHAGDDQISVVLDDSNECQIPWEVLENPGRNLSVGVYGTKGGTVVLPTIWAQLGEIREGVSLGSNAQPPTPDVYSQILEAAEQAEKIAQSVRDDADAGKFDHRDRPEMECRRLPQRTKESFWAFWTALRSGFWAALGLAMYHLRRYQ